MNNKQNKFRAHHPDDDVKQQCFDKCSVGVTDPVNKSKGE